MAALSNTKHEQFAQNCALGMPLSQAYRDCVSGGKCTDRTAEVEGSKLANSPDLSLRISELRTAIGKQVEKKFALTRESWLDRLVTIAEKAEKSEDFSAAQNALDKVGKASAWYEPEKHELTINVHIGGNADGESDH